MPIRSHRANGPATEPLGLFARTRALHRKVIAWHPLKWFWSFLDGQSNSIQAFAALVALGTVVWGASNIIQDGAKQSHYTAWQVVLGAQGQPGSSGRIDALQDLNKDHVSLAGLRATGALLEGIQLPDGNLNDADLSGSTFTKANFHHADLSMANLQRANLVEADLSNSTLWSADLTFAGLVRGNLQYADLGQAKLVNTDLSGADMRGAGLLGADLQGANLYGADIEGAYLGGSVVEVGSGSAVVYVSHLTANQIRDAKNWQYATYSDSDLMHELGLDTNTTDTPGK